MNWFRSHLKHRKNRDRKPLLHTLRRGLISLYLLTMLVVLCGIAWSTWSDYLRTLREGENQTLSLARLLDEHVTRSIISVDQAMQNISEDIEREGGTDKVNERWMHERMKDKVQLTPQIRAVIAMNNRGIIRIHGLEYPARPVNLSDRDYFTYHRDNPSLSSRIGDPIISRTDSKWLIPLTKRLNATGGRFDGIMLAGIEPNYYLNFYESLKLAPGTRVQVLRNDGNILLTYPHDASMMGRNIHQSAPTDLNRLQTSESTFFLAQNNQGNPAYITLLSNQTKLPLIIRISTDRKKMLAQFHTETIIKAGSAFLLMLLITVMLFLLLRQIKRVDESESRLYLTQFTVDESPDMILWCDEHGQIRYSNRCLSESSGYSRQELLKLKYADLLIDNDNAWDELSAQMLELQQAVSSNQDSKHIQAQQRHNLEIQLRTLRGRHIPVETTLSLIAFREQIYLCITARDISARLAAERELVRHRDHLQELVQERTAEVRTVLDASPLAIAMLVQDKIRLVNPAFSSLFGFASDEIVNQSIRLIFETDAAHQQASDAVDSQISKGGAYRGELELRQRSGMIFWATLFAKALDPEMPSRGSILIIEDTTAQRIAAQSIRQSERLKRSILNTTADGFALIDANRHLVDVNNSFCELLGMERQELIGRNAESIWGELAIAIFPLCSTLANDKNFVEITLPAKDGLMHPFLANSGVIPNEKGELEYTFAFLTDISHQKEIENTLVRAKEAAEAANKSKTTFLANMSHELRTPMHAILSFSELGTKKENATPGQLSRYFERIHTSGQRLLTLLNDLLDMSRLEANKMSYEKSRHILQSTMKSAISEISSLLAARQLQIHLDESTPKLFAIYDKARMTQVLVNLLSNAIKFSPQGAAIHIQYINHTLLDNQQPACGLSVRDEGPGVAESDMERIFETFSQSAKPHSAGGTGLGLAISRQIMDDHGGCISVRNHPEGGAEFTILIPLEPPEASTSNESAAE